MTRRSIHWIAPILLLVACAAGPDGGRATSAAAGGSATLRNYVVMIEGRNFLFDDNGRQTRFGFSASRNKRAAGVAEAERVAIQQVHDDETLNGSLRNSAEDPPRITVTHLFEVESFDATPGHDVGYIFYRDRDSK
jgi:hypothetical protein